MKIVKKMSYLLALASICSTVAVPVSARAQELEEIGNGWTITYKTEKSAENYAAFTDEESHGGNWSVKVYSPAGMTSETTRIRIAFPETKCEATGAWNESGKYTVEFYAKGIKDKDSGWSVKAGVFNASTATDSINITHPVLSNEKVTRGKEDENGWVKYSFDFAYDYADTHDEVPFKFDIRATNGVTYYFDDVHIFYSGTTAGNYEDLLTAEEGSFEPKPWATKEDIADYGWSITKNQGSLTAEIVQEVDGNKMLHVVNNRDYDNDKKDIITKSVSAGTIGYRNFRLYFKMKGTYNTGNIEVGSAKYDNYIKYLSNFQGWVTTKELGDGWTQYAVTSYGGDMTAFRVQFNNYADVYLDDFMLVLIDETNKSSSDISEVGEELYGDQLTNGSFDNPSAVLIKDNLLGKWSVEKGSNNTDGDGYIATIDSTHAYSGEYAYYLAGPGSWQNNVAVFMYQGLPEEFDYTKTYTFKAKVYTPGQNTNIRLQFRNSSAGVSADKRLNLTHANKVDSVTDLGNGWYEYTATMTAASGYNRLALGGLGLVGGVWIDDISLTDEDGEEWIVNGSFDEFKVADFGEISLMDDSYESISKPIAGENIANVSINTLEAGQNYTLWLAVYKDGNLFDVNYTEILDAEIGETELNTALTLDSVSDGVYTAKAFLWDDGVNPWIGAAEFTAEE